MAGSFLVESGAGLGRIGGTLKEIGKILTYLCAVLICGALLAPPLYWGAQLVVEAGYLPVLKRYAFQKYLNRGVLIAAFVLLWPMVKWLEIRGRGEFLLGAGGRRGRDLWTGFLVGAVAMAVLAGGYLALGVYRLDEVPEWRKFFGAAASAVVVSLLEESLFRGGINGLFRRSLGVKAAMWATAVLFALVHFIKPDPSVKVGEVFWWSGLALMPHSFHQFAKPMLFLGGFATLLTFGVILGVAANRTRALWMSIGLHAGLVFVKLGFEKVTDRRTEHLPWIGPELQVGLVPVAVLLFAGAWVWWLTKGRPAEGIVPRGTTGEQGLVR